VRKVCVLAACFFPFGALADGFEAQYGIPSSIDLSAKRAAMSEKLPKIGDETPRIRALISYKRDHERFRVGVLEGLNEEIKKICDDLKDIERKVNRDLKNGVLSRNDFDDIIYQIEEERKNCLYENRDSSPYFTELYKASSAEADVLIAECYASNACSGRSQN
jgi:hypothetical protein